jgi:hypothetical protein
MGKNRQLSLGSFIQIWLQTKYEVHKSLVILFICLFTHWKLNLAIFMPFFSLLAIENLQKHFIIDFLIFHFSFWRDYTSKLKMPDTMDPCSFHLVPYCMKMQTSVGCGINYGFLEHLSLVLVKTGAAYSV